MEVRREACRVAELTISDSQHLSRRCKYRAMSTVPTTVKLESTSPIGSELEEDTSEINTNDSLSISSTGIRNWSQEPQKELNCFGFRVADIGTPGCGNIFFTGADFISTERTEEVNTGIHNINKSSTYWQYPNLFPMEPVLSMSPVGLQYPRDPGRGQLLLLPAATAIESLPQATFMWPSYLPHNTAGSLSTTQNYMFSSMSPQSAPHIQLIGTNYLTTPTGAATSTFCQHSQINRFVSISSDIKRLDQPLKEYEMKIEDRSNGFFLTNKASKSKIENGANFIQLHTNSGVDCSAPTDPSQIVLESSPHPPEFINTQICMANFATQSPSVNTRLQLSQDSTVSKPFTPKMQDVNIQTDTPVCSEDEIFLEPDADQCIGHLDGKTKCSLTTQFHTNSFDIKGLSKESPVKSGQAYFKNAVISKDDCLDQTEQSSFESEICISSNANDKSCSDKQTSSADIKFTTFKETYCPVSEISGLELLSNISTGAFDNQSTFREICIKKEPNEYTGGNISERAYDNEMQYCNQENSVQNPLISSNNALPLGGLNLLCALAEQRIQEEVQCNNHAKLAKETTGTKRKKCKHAKLRSRYYKKNKNKNSNDMNVCPDKKRLKSSNLHVNLKNAFKKVDVDYKKLSKWADHQEFFRAMESDMRMRLADITRQYKKKKRKLEEINKLKKLKKRSSTEYKFANISYKNPNFIYFLEKSQNTPPSEAMKNNGYISTQSKSKPAPILDKAETNPESNLNIISKLKHSTSLVSNKQVKLKMDWNENESASIEPENETKSNKITLSNTSLNAMKIDNNDFMDSKLKLSIEHLYCEETRVLTDMGGLFYAGVLKPLQPPDVYAITLDGERGNKSHIMSREEILKDTILEVTPTTINNVPVGTRLCAYWSQQYRCLYPGKAIDSGKCDRTSDFISVEFDDGDSGKIRLENIRFLLSDYPTVEYNKNPLNTLGKNKKTVCIKSTCTQNVSKPKQFDEEKPPPAREEVEFLNENFHVISKSLNKVFTSVNLSNETDNKNRKHKKKKKNKKHNIKSRSKFTTMVDNDKTKLREFDYDTKNTNFDYCNSKNEFDTEEPSSKCSVKENCRKDTMNKGSITEDASLIRQDDRLTSTNCNDPPERKDKTKIKQKIDSNNGKGSKIAAFLPERQLWSWLGHAYRRVGHKGRTRKAFYKSITRGKEIITVGECAVFLSTGRPDRPYIGRIEALWETTTSNKVVRVRWFYHPEETKGCPKLKFPGGLFVSPHEDENDVQTISHRCDVIEFSLYIAKFGTNYKHYESVYDNNDTFYISGFYNPRLQLLKLDPNIPIEKV